MNRSADGDLGSVNRAIVRKKSTKYPMAGKLPGSLGGFIGDLRVFRELGTVIKNLRI